MLRKGFAPALLMGIGMGLAAPSPQETGRDALRLTPAAVRPVIDVYHGVAVTDPYRWLEDVGNPDVLEWARAQGRAARAFLDGLSGRLALEDRLIELNRAVAARHSVQAAAGRFFYLKSEPGDETDKLYVRHGWRGPDRLLYDPARDSRPGRSSALNYFKASFDGRFVALGVSADGSENAVLRFMDVASGAFKDGELDRVVFGPSVNWSADSARVFYTRLRPPAPGEPPVRRYARSGAYAHTMGTAVAEDRLILGAGRDGEIPLADFDVPLLMSQPGSDLLFAAVARGVGRELALWAAAAPGPGSTVSGWKKLCGFEDAVSRPVLHGSRLFGLTSKDAPRFRAVAADVQDPGRKWETVLPPSGLVLTALAAAEDALYIQALDAGLSRLIRRPYGGGEIRTLALPFQGTIRELVADPGAPGVLIRMASWTRPSVWLAFDPETGSFRDPGWSPGEEAVASGFDEFEVKVAGHDGTPIPLSIVMRRGLVPDGSHPAILEAYGSYGAAVTPHFDPSLRAWLERGGIWAFAHVRGGGEYGEEWHRAGMKENKPNAVADFVACAEYLVSRKLTSTRRLAAVGASAGGVVIGGALARRPDLFGAAVIDAGLFDCLRREQEANAQLGTPEFGTLKTEDGFRALLAMSPYHMVRDGGPFPAVLLLTSLNDPRVDPWQSFKAAARLQAATSSGKPVLLRLEDKGGHGVGEIKSREQAKTADIYAFLLDALTRSPKGKQPMR